MKCLGTKCSKWYNNRQIFALHYSHERFHPPATICYFNNEVTSVFRKGFIIYSFNFTIPCFTLFCIYFKYHH